VPSVKEPIMVPAMLINGCSRTPKTCPASMTPVTRRQYLREYPPNQRFYCRKRAAGPRRWVAHNLKVVGSNPTPATIESAAKLLYNNKLDIMD